MKAVLLAAGKGERLGALSDAMPKPLLPVEGKPILEHHIELCKCYGITELFINTHHLPDKITSHFGNGGRFGVSITYSFEKELLGTAGALNNFKDSLKGETFFVIYSDNVTDYNLKELLDFHKEKRGLATLALFEKKNVESSGIAMLDSQGRVLRFMEKPKPGEVFSSLANAGIYVLEPGIFEYIPQGFSDFGKDIFPKLLRAGERVFGMVMKGRLDAVDTLDLYERLKK